MICGEKGKLDDEMEYCNILISTYFIGIKESALLGVGWQLKSTYDLAIHWGLQVVGQADGLLLIRGLLDDHLRIQGLQHNEHVRGELGVGMLDGQVASQGARLGNHTKTTDTHKTIVNTKTYSRLDWRHSVLTSYCAALFRLKPTTYIAHWHIGNPVQVQPHLGQILETRGLLQLATNVHGLAETQIAAQRQRLL